MFFYNAGPVFLANLLGATKRQVVMHADTFISSTIESFIGRRGKRLTDLLLVASLVLYTAGFLAIHKSTNLAFAVLFLLAAIHFFSDRAAFRNAMSTEGARFLIVSLATLFLVVMFGMLVRFRLNLAELDGPARYLIAGLLLLFFLDKRVRFVRIFAIACPLSLTLAFIAAMLNPEVITRWGGRFATSFVDPNSLGSYAAILSMMALLVIDGFEKDSVWTRTLKYSGVAAGILLTLLAASRGGWMAIPPLTALWILFRFPRGTTRLVGEGVLIVFLLVAAVALVPQISTRAVHSTGDIVSWFDGTNTETSPGQRLSIWKLGLQLFLAEPLTGYGIAGVADQLANPDFAALASPTIIRALIAGGPHNDLLTMLLASGIAGFGAYVLLLFGPLSYFWKRRTDENPDVRLASELGIFLCVGVLVCGITNEMLSMKYLCSFYAITVAGLAAQVLVASPRDQMSSR